MNQLIKLLKGGQGSGDFGHEGRPGEVGGSSSGFSSQRLTPEDSQALKSYSGVSGYLYANGVLRGNPNLGTRQKEQGQELVRQMDQAFKNSPDETGEEKTVYRGIALDRLPGNPEQIVGQEIPVDSYMSVSTQRSVANGFPQGRKPIGRARLDIKVPPGTRYIDVTRHSQHPEENEWLFHRGSRIKITGASKREIIPPAWVLTAELIPSSLSKMADVPGTDWFDDDWLHYPSYRPIDHLLKILKGGAGSGNFGHEGRPGEIGGSASESISTGHPESTAVLETQKPARIPRPRVGPSVLSKFEKKNLEQQLKKTPEQLQKELHSDYNKAGIKAFLNGTTSREQKANVAHFKDDSTDVHDIRAKTQAYLIKTGALSYNPDTGVMGSVHSYRGINLPRDVALGIKPGDNFDVGKLACFSEDKRTSHNFSRNYPGPTGIDPAAEYKPGGSLSREDFAKSKVSVFLEGDLPGKRIVGSWRTKADGYKDYQNEQEVTAHQVSRVRVDKVEIRRHPEYGYNYLHVHVSFKG